MANKVFKVQAPDGKVLDIEGPEDATDDELQAAAAKHYEESNSWSGLGSAGMGALQGATVGFADEIYGAGRGALDALTGEGFNYSKRRDEARGTFNQAREDNPGSYLAGEVGGGVALPLGMIKSGATLAKAATAAPNAGKLSRAATGARNLATAPVRNLTATAALPAEAGMLARMGAGAKEGAAWGGLYGFGSGEGDAMSQASSIAGGTLLGGGVGSALPAIFAGARGLGNTVADPYRGFTKPTQFADEKYIESIARDRNGGDVGPNLVETLKGFDRRAQNYGARDPSLTVGDLAGDAQQGLLRSAVDTPNSYGQKMKNFITQRNRRQPYNIEEGMKGALGDSQTFVSTIDDIVAKRDAQAAKDYAASFTKPTRITPELKNVFERPLVKRKIAESEELLKLMDMPVGFETRTEMVNILKKKMDRMISGNKRAWQSGSAPGAEDDMLAWMKAKDDLIAAIAPQNKKYIETLKKFSDESALRDAVQDGFDEATKLMPEELAKKISKLPDDQKQLYRLGWARKIMEPILKDPDNLDNVRNFTSVDMRRRMKAVFPDAKERRAFQRMLAIERKKKTTEATLYGGSKTSKNQRFGEDAGKGVDASIDVGQTISNAASGNLLGFGRAASTLLNRFKGMTPEVSAEILKLSRTPAAASDMASRSSAISRIAKRNDPTRGQDAQALMRGGLGAFYGATRPLTGSQEGLTADDLLEE